jgi:hypothetical protein
MAWTQIVYASSYINEYGFDLPNFLETLSLANDELSVRGMTLFSHGNIMQMLEGDFREVSDVFEKLNHDARNIGVLKLLEESVDVRKLKETCIGFNAHSVQLPGRPPTRFSLFRLNPAEVESRIFDCAAKILMLQFAADCL